MLSLVRCDSSVSVVSPPASAIASSKVTARSTDWMLWRSERSVGGRGTMESGAISIARFLRTVVLSSTAFPHFLEASQGNSGDKDESSTI
jgi:hypothetical protein